MTLPRVFISTDLKLSSEEKDDAQSLIHALLYQDKMNIVGIAGTASRHVHQNGTVGDIDKIIDVYAKDHAKLEAHSTAFKTASELKDISWQGATGTAPGAGYSKPTDSSRAIIAEAKAAAAAGEKLNVLTWGGETDMAQALHDDPSIAKHVRFFNISVQDANAHKYISNNFKGVLDMWVDDRSTFRGMYQTPESSGIIKGWHEVHAKDHGALGEMFADISGDIFNVSGVKMGDSPTVLRFLSGDQDDPTKESWGGEFIKVSNRYYTDNPDPNLDLNRSNTKGAWTVYEDREAWMSDFAKRLDWLKDGSTGPAEPETQSKPSVSLPTGENLLVNGSFESASVTNGQYGAFDSLTGWKALGGSKIEVWNNHNGVKATDGKNFVELDYLSAQDGFYQKVDADTGQEYALSFDLRTRPGKSASSQDVQVMWNDKVVATAKPDSDWGTFTTKVVGVAGQDTLTIREVGSQSKDGYGALLDDFQLVATKAEDSPTVKPPVTPPTVQPPTVDSDVIKIMPLGDSNTYGMYENKNSPGGYRGPLYDMLKGKGVEFDFVGQDRDGRIGDADHNGYSGKTIDWFTKPVNESIKDRDGSFSHTVNSEGKSAIQFFIEKAAMTSKDAILLNLGVNDVRLGDSAATMLAEMRTLLDQIVGSKESPSVHVMTATPVSGDRWTADGDPDRTNNDTIQAFNEGLARLVNDKYGALGVKLVESGVTNSGLSSDGVHLNSSGYEGMARAWLDSLSSDDPVVVPPVAPPAVPSGTNLLVNGSFESAAVSKGQYGAFDSLKGWEAISGGKIEVWNQHGGVKATDGGNFVELDYLSARDGFYQDVSADTGQDYTLSLDLRTRPGKSASTQDVEIVWNGEVVAIAKPGSDWGRFTTKVTGEAGTDRLTIREVASQSKDGYGALLDDVRLVATDEAPDPVAPTPPVAGNDTLSVRVSGDSYKGDPSLALTVNGKTIAASKAVSADHAEGEWDTFVFSGDFGLDGSDRVGIAFLNDAYAGPGKDRNLYVDEVVLNGEVNGTDHTFLRSGTEYWEF